MADRLVSQCKKIGWSLQTVYASRLKNNMWSYGGHDRLKPEEVICCLFSEQGKFCSWCEGASINLLIKAASLDVLAKLNTFSDREDAVRRYLEAQFTILSKSQDFIFNEILTITKDRLLNNVFEICSDELIKYLYPKVKFDFISKLSNFISKQLLLDIAKIFMKNPYNYRSGWPDITIIDGNTVLFVEVKTTDILHKSQIRFALEVASPLNLSCSVYQLKPKHE